MVNVATLTAQLKADTRNFERGVSGAKRDIQGLERSTGKSTSRMDKQIGNTGVTWGTAMKAGTGVAAIAVGKFVSDSIRDANNLQESINAVEKVFGPVADEIHNLGETSAQEFGMAQDTFNNFAVRFSAFADNIANNSGRDVVEIVDEMSGRVADFASVHNLSLERAAEVAQSTLAGETEVFRRFGGDVSAAAVEAKALEEGIIETGEAMTEQDKIMARYMLFMEQTSDTAGDFKDTQDDLANASRTFQAELTDARAEIGEALLPTLAELVGVGRDLIPVFKNVATELVTITEQAAPLIDALMFVNDLMGDNAEGAEEAGEKQTILGAAFQSVMDFANPLGAIYREVTDALEDNAEASIEAASELTDQEQAARDAFAANKELSDEFSTLGGEMNQIPEAAERVASSQGEMETKIRASTSALIDQHNAIRAQTDPLFALQRATDRAAEAQDAVNQARKEFGAGSPEHLQAIQDAAQANADVKGALLDVKDATNLSKEAFIIQQTQMGLSREEAQLLADQLEALDGFEFAPKRLTIQAKLEAAGIPGGAAALFGSAGATLRQHGGPFLAHQPLVVGERGPELVSFDRPGMVDSGMGARGGGGDTIIIPVHVGGEKIDEIIVDANTRLERRGRR